MIRGVPRCPCFLLTQFARVQCETKPQPAYKNCRCDLSGRRRMFRLAEKTIGLLFFVAYSLPLLGMGGFAVKTEGAERVGLATAARAHRTQDPWVPTELKPLANEPLPSGKQLGTVYLVESTEEKKARRHVYRVVPGKLDSEKGAAWGFYNDVTNTIGWSILQIDTSKSFADEEQMYAAGLLEGFLTATRIRQLFINGKALRDAKQLNNLYSYFEVQDDFIRQKYSAAMGGAAPKSSDEHDQHAYWRQVGLELAQLDGLLDGYNQAVPEAQRLRLCDLWLLNMDGDVIDLERAFSTGQLSVNQVSNEAETRRNSVGGAGDLTGNMKFIEISSRRDASAGSKTFSRRLAGLRPRKKDRYTEKKWDILQRHSRCSALVKVLPDYSDVYVGHTTWADYSELLRIWKTYNFNLNDPSVVAKKMSFSSYAGMISSTDDWYILDSGMLVLETTINVEDENALSQINPKGSVVSWIRTMVANRLASDGKEWTNIYAQQNSGTYNCQWMVLDYKKFSPGKPPQAGFFNMIEQVPGKVHMEDMTDTLLRRGDDKCNGISDPKVLKSCKQKHMYWPSINRPYWKDIRNSAGYPLEDTNSPQNEFFSFEDNPRGRVFQRDQQFIGSVLDMMSMMQYNDPSDPLQRKAGHAIASRFDVPDAENGDVERRPTGGIESKVTCAKMIKEMVSVTQLGPAHDMKLPKWRDPTGQKKGAMKPFRWDSYPKFMDVEHYGIPNKLDFPWQLLGPGFNDYNHFPQEDGFVKAEVDKREIDIHQRSQN